MADEQSTRPEGSKVATLSVSVGPEDERDIETFISDLKELIAPHVRRVTGLGGYYLIEGQPIRSDGTHYLTGEQEHDFRTPSGPPEPKPRSGPRTTQDQEEVKQAEVREAAKKVGGGLSMRKGDA